MIDFVHIIHMSS